MKTAYSYSSFLWVLFMGNFLFQKDVLFCINIYIKHNPLISEEWNIPRKVSQK